MNARQDGWTRRETLVVGAGGLSALLLAACGSDGSSDGSSGSTTTVAPTPHESGAPVTSAADTAEGWSFTDDRGVTTTLPTRPERVVAYVGTAAVLWDFGIRPVGVFGPQRQTDGTPEPAAGNVDLDAVQSVGETWDGVNLELLAALQPDLVVSGGTVDPWVITDQLDVIAEIAPIALVEVYQDSASGIIGNYERLAEALGADLQSADLVAARKAYDEAAARLSSSAAAKPGLQVMATYADAEALYIAKPVDFPDLRQFAELGVDMVVPDTDEDYWQTLSWEQADTYPADLLIHDIRSYSLQPDVLATEAPMWSAMPAVRAGQIAGWSAEAVLSYQGFTVAMNDLAAAIDQSAADVV